MEAQFIAYYDEFADTIYRHCYYRVFDRELAKDLMQDTFAKAWQYAADGNTIDNIRAFLYTTANHCIIDYTRKKKDDSVESLIDQGVQLTKDGTDELHTVIDAHALINIMQRLDAEEREVLLLRYLDGFKPRHIADILGESPNIISIRITRAKKKLKALLKTRA